MNLKATADAIALRFVGATATVGAVTETIATSTASLPNTVGKGPVVLVYHPGGALEIGVGRMRNDHYNFPVKILRDPLNYPARSDWLYAWHDATRDLVEGNMNLDLAYVAWAKAVAVRVELDGESYAGVDYDVIEYTIQVLFREVVATVNI